MMRMSPIGTSMLMKVPLPCPPGAAWAMIVEVVAAVKVACNIGSWRHPRQGDSAFRRTHRVTQGAANVKGRARSVSEYWLGPFGLRRRPPCFVAASRSHAAALATRPERMGHAPGLTCREAPQYFFGVDAFELPVLSGARGLACRLLSGGARARPDPAGLVHLLGLPCGAAVATARQIHSNRCLVVGAPGAPVGTGRLDAGEGDALLTTRAGVALGVATADCLPIAAVDPEAGALAVVHAGWRGTVDGVLSAAISRMVQDLGARPDRILVGAGAAAGPCCYRVGADVVERFRQRRPAHAEGVFS